MFPSLLNSERVAVPPPHSFRPLIGTPRHVTLMDQGWTRTRGDTAAREAGLRYEEKVQEKLQDWNGAYIPSPRITFYDASGYRVVIPDGLLSLASHIVIFEVKSQHMPEAWWQLERLYRPVLQVRRPLCPITCVEICRSYDPAMPFPAEFHTLSSLDEILQDSAVSLAVLPWKL